jgi:hypothetical protein
MVANAEELSDGLGGVEGQVLRQVADLAGHLDTAAGRTQVAGGEPQQRRLAGAVDADQARAARAEEEVEAVEDGGAVRPGEAD